MLGYIEHGEDLCDGDDQRVVGDVAARTDAAAVPEGVGPGIGIWGLWGVLAGLLGKQKRVKCENQGGDNAVDLSWVKAWWFGCYNI